MNYIHKIKYILFALLLVVFITSCDDEAGITDPPEEHFEAEGLILSSSGMVVASIFQGVTEDTLYVPLGEMTDHMEVTFYDSDQNEIEPPADEDKTLVWEIENTTVIDVHQHEGEEGGYELHLVGLSAGITEIEFFISHEGHNDFRSYPIPVKVQ